VDDLSQPVGGTTALVMEISLHHLFGNEIVVAALERRPGIRTPMVWQPLVQITWNITVIA